MFFLVKLKVPVLSPEPSYWAPGLRVWWPVACSCGTGIHKYQRRRDASFILIKQVKAKTDLKKKKKSYHLNKQVHNIFRLQSARYPATCNEFTLLRPAPQRTLDSGCSPGLPEAVNTAEDDGVVFGRATAQPASSLISGRPLTSQLTFLTHIPP